MTATIGTLNATVAQIEDMLATGQSVEAVARELQEPRSNVLAVWHAMRTRPAADPSPSPGGTTRPLASVPTTPVTASAPSVDALVGAAARSASKRTQVLGVRLHDLAQVLRDRLNGERDAAVKAERVRAERAAASAEVTRLEEQLRAAKERAGIKRGGSGSVSSRKGQPLTDERRAKMLAGQVNTTPCVHGCGVVAKTKSGKSAHERACGGAK